MLIAIYPLVIAGLHVGVIAGALMFLVRRIGLPRGWGLAIVAGLIAGYAILVDVQPPVVRATILVLVTCWSLYLGRRPLGYNALAAGALIVLALNPTDLFSVGAQLSFLSVGGLVWFAPWWMYSTKTRDPLRKLIRENESWLKRAVWAIGRSLRHLTLVSFLIGLLTMPLVMARFHLFAPVAILLNTLVWVPTSVGLVAGFATLVLGSLAWPLGQLAGMVCEWSLWAMEEGVALGRRLPGGHLWVPGPADWWLAGFYGALGLLAAFPRLRPPRRWCVALLAAWIGLGFGASMLHRRPVELRCTFLSVGHGCATVLELPSGQTLLYDAGRLGAPYSAARSIAACLWSRSLRHLDAVVLSHADLDHYNALPPLKSNSRFTTIRTRGWLFSRYQPIRMKSRCEHRQVSYAPNVVYGNSSLVQQILVGGAIAGNFGGEAS